MFIAYCNKSSRKIHGVFVKNCRRPSKKVAIAIGSFKDGWDYLLKEPQGPARAVTPREEEEEDSEVSRVILKPF